MIAVIYFSYDYFSDDRIDLSGQPFNNVIVNLTQYRNLKLVPSLPDTLMRSVVGSVQGKSVIERVKVLGIEKVPTGAARERGEWRKKVMEDMKIKNGWFEIKL